MEKKAAHAATNNAENPNRLLKFNRYFFIPINIYKKEKPHLLGWGFGI